MMFASSASPAFRQRKTGMKILGIESAALTASVALVTDGMLTAEYTVTDKKTHSQTLLPMLDELKRSLDLELGTLDAIAISAGPGSFTGLRIGAATAKGLGLVLQKPLVAVSTLEALAYNLAGSERLLCPVMDARRSQVYNGLYRRKATEDGDFSSGGLLETVAAPRAVSAEALVEELNARGEAVIFVGDGIPVMARLAATLTVPYAVAAPNNSRARAASVAALGEIYAAAGKTVSPEAFAPEYLRKSQAEREREEAIQYDLERELAAGVSPKKARAER